MADFGYDVADYCDVDPLFGDLADFDRLVAEAHARELQVLIDWVPNHSSDQHPWFVGVPLVAPRPANGTGTGGATTGSDADGGSGAPGSPGRAPNNWLAALPRRRRDRAAQPAWTWDEATGQWYLHLFLPEQPDLNWANPEVRAAMDDVLRFWMERGVDGFRVDVAHGLGKDPALPDVPSELTSLPVASLNDRSGHPPDPGRAAAVIDAWPHAPARMMVGEVYLPTTAQVATLLRHGRLPGAAPVLQLPPAVRTVGRRRLAGVHRRGRRPGWTRPGRGPPGCSPTTTSPATAPATGPRRGPERPPCCC